MDEEDGRSGPLAALNGQLDALMDALPKSLRPATHPHASNHRNAHTPALAALFGEEGRGCCPGMTLPFSPFAHTVAPVSRPAVMGVSRPAPPATSCVSPLTSNFSRRHDALKPASPRRTT